ncbi:hypothetical protein HO133_000476 [Letharia lupina]|uniref:Uncharacterized protein n=1 Tax=Letharia lupina TaxID=560253 RepID=A0A8H6CHI2_9LECA|nr:uncharacterized protein HO133_000476 [Letharia lupina]KAF6223633.1 hypothetical protein HO133_000476 [Letharia lupina]
MDHQSYTPQPYCILTVAERLLPIVGLSGQLDSFFQNITPHPDECVERWKVEVQRDYDQLIALGGRPTRSIRPQFIWKVTIVDGMFSYRDEDNKTDVTQEVDVTLDEEGLAHTHWSEEWAKWAEELRRWQKFKEDQQRHNQLGRSETDLELENTDVDLVEVLSKLDDWQLFEFVQQKKVHDAERFHEQCQQEIARLEDAMVTARAAKPMRAVEEPHGGWMWQMETLQKELEASQEELMWVKSQWTEVLAEASHSIAASPKLQKQLEEKLEKQTNKIYRHLQQREARPSNAVHRPDTTADFPQRLQHWISESSAITAELWDWRIFMAWRRNVKGADTKKQEEQKQPFQVDADAKLFEDLVKYCQYELDKASSWVYSWRCRASHYAGAKKSTALQERIESLLADDEDDDYQEARAYAYAQPQVTESDQAEIYAKQAEQKVSDAAKRLERAQQQLQNILARRDRPSTGEIPAEDSEAQLPPTPAQSQSSKGSLPKNQKPSNKSSTAGKDHRRSKKKEARKRGANLSNTNTQQQTLPDFSSGSDQFKIDDDIEMSDVLEDTIMSDSKDPPNHIPPSSSKLITPPSSSPHASTSRKTRSSTKLNQPLSDKVSKKMNTNKKPTKKFKGFTELQVTTLLNAASTSRPCTNSIAPRRSERLKEKAAISKRRVCT